MTLAPYPWGMKRVEAPGGLMGKEFLLVALLALFSDVVVPKVSELASKPQPEAEEAVEEEEAEEEDGELERLREENRILKELVGEKELALRNSSED